MTFEGGPTESHRPAEAEDQVAEQSGEPAELVSLLSLHPGAVRLWRIEGVVRGIFLTAAVVIAELVLRTPVPLGAAVVAVAAFAAGYVVFLPPLRYRAWGFAVRDADLYLRYGVLFRTTSIVPHARIQHVDTRHGPIERWLGLAELVVYTAGSRGALVSVPALEREFAESLRDRLASLSGAGDAV